MEWLWRHKMASISYQSKYLTRKLNSKPPWIKASQMARCWISKERKFLNILATWKGTGNNFQVPFVFLIIYIKRLGLKTTKFDFLRILILLFQKNLFPKEFLEYIGYIFSFIFRFFFMKTPYMILYQLTEFQFQISTFEDIKQLVFWNSSSDSWWRHKL